MRYQSPAPRDWHGTIAGTGAIGNDDQPGRVRKTAPPGHTDPTCL